MILILWQLYLITNYINQYIFDKKIKKKPNNIKKYLSKYQYLIVF